MLCVRSTKGPVAKSASEKSKCQVVQRLQLMNILGQLKAGLEIGILTQSSNVPTQGEGREGKGREVR